MDHDLVARDLSHLIPSSRTKIAYLKTTTCLYTRSNFIDELLVAAKSLISLMSGMRWFAQVCWLPLLLDRVGVRRIKNKAKSFI